MNIDPRLVPVTVLMDPATGEILRDDGTACAIIPMPPEGQVPEHLIRLHPDYAASVRLIRGRPTFRPLKPEHLTT